MTVKCICMHFGNFWCKSVSVNWRSVFQWLNLFFYYQNCHQSPSTKMNQRLYTVTLVRDVFFSGQLCKYARRSGIMASALDFASRGLGLRLGWVSVFVLGQNTLVSACLSPPRSIKRYWWIVREAWRNAGGGPLRWTSIPSRGGGSCNTPCRFMLLGNQDKLWLSGANRLEKTLYFFPLRK